MSSGRWWEIVVAVVLIVLGILFLLGSLGYVDAGEILSTPQQIESRWSWLSDRQSEQRKGSARH